MKLERWDTIFWQKKRQALENGNAPIKRQTGECEVSLGD